MPAGQDPTTPDSTRDTRWSQPRNQKRIFGSILEGKGAEDNVDREPVWGTPLFLGTNYPRTCSQWASLLPAPGIAKLQLQPRKHCTVRAAFLPSSRLCLENPFCFSGTTRSCCHSTNTGWPGCCPSCRPPWSNITAITTRVSFLAT